MHVSLRRHYALMTSQRWIAIAGTPTAKMITATESPKRRACMMSAAHNGFLTLARRRLLHALRRKNKKSAKASRLRRSIENAELL